MPLTAAEKQKLYRERLKQDKEKYESVKDNARKRYHNKKKLISDLSKREKRLKRRQWRIQKKKQRDYIKNLRTVQEMTPPSSPNEVEQVQSGNSRRGRKRLRRDRSKLYKENEELKRQNAKLLKDVEKYKKRAYRAGKKSLLETNSKSKTKTESPLSKTETFIQTHLPGINSPGVEKVKKQVFKYNVLAQALTSEYKNTTRRSDKQTMKKFLKNKKLQRYGLVQEIRLDTLGIKHNVKMYLKKGSKLENEVQKIKDFFHRDDISRATAGKKETVTRNKKKVQKRFLLDTMKNLHKRYIKEGGISSYTSFTRFRPFYIVKPSIDARETCLCRLHTNILLKFSALRQKKVLLYNDVNTVITSVVCNTNSRNCMYNECADCKTKSVTFSNTSNDKISWFEWIRKEETYEKDGKQKKVTKTVKERKEGYLDNLKVAFIRELLVFTKHVFNIKQQYRAYRQCLDNLKLNEVAIHIDFSENYNCKMTEEIQGHHFGASRNQITLHTGVLYQTSQSKPLSFCSVSDDNQHNPAAIWAHLKPIFSMIRKNDEIDTIHVFSDGPFSQYRQKENFYLFCHKLFEWGFKTGSWSFFEAGHGKGAADGIGGALKRRADQIVAFGDDIVNATDFVNKVGKTSSIHLFIVTSDDIANIRTNIPNKIEVLKGTKKIHQLFTKEKGSLFHRELSCYCADINKNGIRNCFEARAYLPIKKFTVSRIPTRKGCGIYSSSDESDTTESNAESNKENIYYSQDTNIINQGASTSGSIRISSGQFLLVEIVGGKKSIKYQYAAIAQTDIEADGELKVMFLKALDASKRKFRVDERDISYIDYEQVKQVLEVPVMKMKGDRIHYEFHMPIDIFER